MKKSHEGGKRKISTRTTEPRVGIFWVVSGNPLIDSTSLSEAEPYGDNLTHPRGHAKVWEHYQRNGLVSREMEYEESPRGRVMYNTKTQRFTFLADRCILKHMGIVRSIMSEMNLPEDTAKDTDSHYQCFACSHGRNEDLL
jgi:hypothetical protein